MQNEELGVVRDERRMVGDGFPVPLLSAQSFILLHFLPLLLFLSAPAIINWLMH